MEEFFGRIVESVALAVELGAAVFIAVGALEAFYHLGRRLISPSGSAIIHKKQIWVRFAIWLLLALEFELAADVLRSAISPTWDDIGQLGAIAVIRTLLNYFLERDIEKYGESERPHTAVPVSVEG
jgi:uncharacterized membrane protein